MAASVTNLSCIAQVTIFDVLNNEFDRAVKFFRSKRGYAHILSMNQLIFVPFLIFLTPNSTRQLGPDLAFGFVNKRFGYEIRDFINL